MLIKTNSLTPTQFNVIVNKATERPNTGEFCENITEGTYLCRQCGLALFRSDQKFAASCGWPSFDAEIDSNVKKLPDPDKIRTEILCNNCDAHLGHIFHGERYTKLNTRYCVNSVALDFVEDRNVLYTEEAILAAGCFWGVEYLLKQQKGILFTEVGYTGDPKFNNPTYEQVCRGLSIHVEAVRVIFDPSIISYTDVIKLFFEIHNFSQTDGQGPDRGAQYLSKIFYYDDSQQEAAERIIFTLKSRGYNVATQLQPVSTFWAAEESHQDYYTKHQKTPYCHSRQKIF